MDHESALTTTASELMNMPGTDVRALRPIKSPTPPKPKRLPVSSAAFQCHCLAAAAESRKTQIGSLAINSEASPDGTFCSAQCSVPCPMRKKKTPMMMLARICAHVGRKRLTMHQTRRMEPAER